MNILITSNHGNTLNPKGGTDARKHNLIKELAKYNQIILLESDRYIKDMDKKIGGIDIDYYNEYYFFKKPLSLFTDINPTFIYNIYRILSNKRIDIIQVSSYPAGIAAIKLIIKLTRKKCVLVYDAHNVEGDNIKNIFSSNYNYFTNFFLYLYVPILERISAKIVDHIIAVSSNDKNIFLKKYGIDFDKISVIPSGTIIRDIPNKDVKAIARNKLGIGKEKTVILFHGTYSYIPNKQALKLINEYIAPNINKKFENAIFIIAGNGTPKIKNANVLSLGFVDDLDLLLKAADIAVVPILSGGGTRLKILDYFAFGLPVISTEKGIEGICAENNESAIITKNVDEEFINGLESLIGSEDLRQNIGYSGHKLAKQHFDWEKIGLNLNKIYTKIIKN